ncbi:PEGA domain-containing protein [Methylopila sp. 73B]|uniref:PEGA domain-containing protein n=1 Tax=Methylopila sp. 73B TaxID=1120792 RepID=UPI00037E1557|nr:PEGA domain-containing protein [Methylopila sp. 73B]
MRFVLVIAAAASLAGCASITRGSTNQITVTTEPAGASVRTSMNHGCPTSPCTFTVGRKDEFIVTASKPGYRDAAMPVKTRIAGSGAAGFAGNVLVGGVIGMGVDAATGATLEHYPNPIVLALQPEAPASAPGPRRKKAPASGPGSKPVAQAEITPAS